MEKMMRIAYVALLSVLCGCSATRRSNVADTLGYSNDSRTAEMGPYQVHYGSNGDSDLLLIAEENRNLLSKESTNSTVFVDGLSFVDYSDVDGDGVVDRFMIHLRNTSGDEAITLVDYNADGTIDHQIDHSFQIDNDCAGDRWRDRKEDIR